MLVRSMNFGEGESVTIRGLFPVIIHRNKTANTLTSACNQPDTLSRKALQVELIATMSEAKIYR